MDIPDVQVDSVVDLVIPVLDMEDGRVELAADALEYISVSSFGEATRRDPYSIVSPGERVSDRGISGDRAASSLSDPDVRAWAASDHSIVNVRARDAMAVSGTSHRESIGLLSSIIISPFSAIIVQ